VTWSIQQVARMSGVTARTLRHYDDIGLLRPAHVGANGYRYYGRVELMRLQRILLLRELGMDLTAIGSVVDGDHDQIEALRSHRDRLLDEAARLARLADTVAATIVHLEKGTDVPAETLFVGFRFTRESLAQLEALTVERTGEPNQPGIAEVKKRTRDWTAEQFAAVDRHGAQIEHRLLALLRTGTPADDPAVLDVLADDVAGLRHLMDPTADTYAALGEAFAATPELRAHLDAQDPGLAAYMRDAMVAYARIRMG
jgi:MerR family transcriptional regulator, thiopeptide resistance regulator